MDKELILRPIGKIQSPFKQKFGTPRQTGMAPSSQGVLQLDAELCPQGCLDDLAEFSHLWLVFHFHQNRKGNTNGKVHPPRLNGDKVGLFASRTPHRPNPLGLSLVQLDAVDPENGRLHISNFDLIDGTPILDIKPYIAEYDTVASSRKGWLEKTSDSVLKVEWETTNTQLSKNLVQLIEESLCRDVRSQDDKRLNNAGPFKTFIADLDVHFVYRDNTVVAIQEIRFNR